MRPFDEFQRIDTMHHCTQSPWLTSFEAGCQGNYFHQATDSHYVVYICEYLLIFSSNHASQIASIFEEVLYLR